MKISVLTIFPDLFANFARCALLGKAIEAQICTLDAVNIRDYAEAPHHQVDDMPYGGGPGMVMKPEPLAKAIQAAKEKLPQAKVLLLAANGHRLTQAKAQQFADQGNDLLFICGRYEGIDQRIIDLFVDEEISIGDYVLMGGEVAAMVCIEAIVRLLPGVIGNPESLQSESFAGLNNGILEGPQYTRPLEFMGKTVPEVLRSGNHAAINTFRKEMSKEHTARKRPDLVHKS